MGDADEQPPTPTSEEVPEGAAAKGEGGSPSADPSPPDSATTEPEAEPSVDPSPPATTAAAPEPEPEPPTEEVPDKVIEEAGASDEKQTSKEEGGTSSSSPRDKKSPVVAVDVAKSVGTSASKDLFDFVACFQVLGEKTPEGEKARKVGFRAADPNGNGLCSLAELETFVMSSLMSKYPKNAKTKVEKGRDLWDLFRPSYIKAFQDAKDYKKDDGDVIAGTKSATADDFVSKGEFRLFCAYLCIYATMYDAFSKVDGGGEGRGGDDRKIDLDEWLVGYSGVKEHGFAGLASVTDDASAKEVFTLMDDNGGGVLMLDEWCDYLKKKEVEAGTKLGETLNEDEELSGKGEAATAAGGGGGGGGGGKAKKTAKNKPTRAPKVYSSGLEVGSGASTELFNFMDLFHPFAEKTPEAEKMREEGFITADPNGNGLCSLAELETYVLKSLVTKFPKTGKGKDMKEPGKDLFDAFRPCYIRAFSDAKDYEKDTGAKIEGTKKATADDFVSKKEFRLFNAYLCIYACMYDAFSKVDGGGAGRDKNDDRRIDLKEMEVGFKGIVNYGFVAFKKMEKKADAKKVFQAMDDNGGGIVLLDEWCEFLKQAEIKAGTELGKILAEDEVGGVGKDFSIASSKGPRIAVRQVSGKKTVPKKQRPLDLLHSQTSTNSNKGGGGKEGQSAGGEPHNNNNKPMTPLQRRKMEAAKKQAHKDEVDKQRAAKAAATSLASTLGPRNLHPGINGKDCPTPPSFTYQHLGLGEWVVDSERDHRLNSGAQRRLQVKVRTRKILARRAERNSDLEETVLKATAKIGFLTADTNYEAVRQDLLDLMNNRALAAPISSSSSDAAAAASSSSPSSEKGSRSNGGGASSSKVDVFAATGLTLFTPKAQTQTSLLPGGVGGKMLGGGGGGGSSSGPSKELKDLVSVFAPYAEPPPPSPSPSSSSSSSNNSTSNSSTMSAGEALRKSGFTLADPNGNGLCSLAELEGFVLKALLAKFPKTAGKGGDRGRDLFDAFRPCYIRAFSDAKDYKADTGKVISGTKKATADDFVSKGEFRFFCAYVCIYGAMFDAFAKIDGGGAGRDANDDRRIDQQEFLSGFRGLSAYGFECFKSLTDKGSAVKVFKQMDDNGGGFVLLDEFCTFIKATEMKEGTAMGLLLGADEDGGVGKQDRATKLATAEARKNAASGGGGGGASGVGSERSVWDPTGSFFVLLLRLAFNSSATYDKGQPQLGNASGGSNNCGLGGATMRFNPADAARPPAATASSSNSNNNNNSKNKKTKNSAGAADEAVSADTGGTATPISATSVIGWEAVDVQNRGLPKAVELVVEQAILPRYPKLSRSDLWVLASYAAVEVLGGPRIAFVGGRFDARDASLAPPRPAVSLSKSMTLKAHTAQFSYEPTLLPPLDCQPDMRITSSSSSSTSPSVLREKPTIDALRAWAKRLSFSDREVVALLIGCRGRKRGRVGIAAGSRAGAGRVLSGAAASGGAAAGTGGGGESARMLAAASLGTYWAEDLSVAEAEDKDDLEAQRNALGSGVVAVNNNNRHHEEEEEEVGGGDKDQEDGKVQQQVDGVLSFGVNGSLNAHALLKHHWIEVTRDSNAKFHEALRPTNNGERCFASIGLRGYEASVEAWAPDGGLLVTPTELYPGRYDDKGNTQKGTGKMVPAGTSFRFKSKKMSYYTPPQKGSQAFGVISYELCEDVLNSEDGQSSKSGWGGGWKRGVGGSSHGGMQLSGRESSSFGWVHDFDPTNPTLRLVKMASGVTGLPRLMAHARDMCLAWDPSFRKELELYADLELGPKRLSADFAVAFKRLTELGFQDSANEPSHFKERKHIEAYKRGAASSASASSSSSSSSSASEGKSSYKKQSVKPGEGGGSSSSSSSSTGNGEEWETAAASNKDKDVGNNNNNNNSSSSSSTPTGGKLPSLPSSSLSSFNKSAVVAVVLDHPENRSAKQLLSLCNDGTLAKLLLAQEMTTPAGKSGDDSDGDGDGGSTATLFDRLMKCAATGLANPDSSLGCYAMHPSDYDDLDFFFDPVCNDYHNNPNGDKVHTTNWSLKAPSSSSSTSSSSSSSSSLLIPEDGVLDMRTLGLSDPLSMRVRVGRNLKAFPLPGAMTKSDRITFEKTMLGAFETLVANKDYGGSVFSMTPHADWQGVTGEAENPNLITTEKYDELVKAHVMFKDMDADPYLKSAGIASDWPCGRGCYQSEDGGFIIWFGEEDQLRIMCMGKGFVLNEVFDRLHTALQLVESIKGIEFATSSKYGFVTSCPTNLGTGMRASVHLKIPNLTADGTDTKAVEVAKPLGLSVRGTGGEHTPIGADGTVDISPSNRLFITEADIITKLYTGIKLLLEEERKAVAAGV